MENLKCNIIRYPFKMMRTDEMLSSHAVTLPGTDEGSTSPSLRDTSPLFPRRGKDGTPLWLSYVRRAGAEGD